MAVFPSDDILYRTMRALFEAMRAEIPNPIDQLAAQKMLVRLRFSNPTAQILVNGRRPPVTVQYGPPAQPAVSRPDLDAEMAADIFHQILLDDLSLKSAIAGKQIKVRGALWKTSSLADILDRGRQLYPAIYRQISS